MSDYNKAIISGRLGADPEIRHTRGGSSVANFSVATSERFKDSQGEPRERTEWHKIVAWGKLAELCQKYLTKGRRVLVEGKLQTRKWEDRDGNTRHTTEIHAREVIFMDSAREREPAAEAPSGGEVPF